MGKFSTLLIAVLLSLSYSYIASMASVNAWLSVLVLRGLSIVKPRTVVACDWTDSFGCLLEKTDMLFREEVVESVKISKNEQFVDPCHIVPLNAPVSLCDKFHCHCVCFLLGELQEKDRPIPRNVFSILMSSQRQSVLPPKGKCKFNNHK